MSNGWRDRCVARVLVLALFGGLCSYAAAASAPTTAHSPELIALANYQAALQSANQMLTDVVLPADMTAVAGEPAGDAGLLARPGSQFWVAAQINQPAFWTSGASPSAVMTSITTHLPADAKTEVSGFAGSMLFATYTFPIIHPSSLGARQLAIEVAPLSDGRTGVRADAQVEYIAPRPYGERVPRQARELTVTMKRGSKVLFSRTITRHSKIRAIAEAIDALPFAGYLFPQATRCSGISANTPVDTFTFHARPSRRALARVREPADTPTFETSCGTTSLVIRGHRKHLQDSGKLLRTAGTILGVKLTGHG